MDRVENIFEIREKVRLLAFISFSYHVFWSFFPQGHKKPWLFDKGLNIC